MNALRRTLYLQAAVWAVAGAALALVPRFVLHAVFDQPSVGEAAWVRLAGVESFTLAMLMVLVAHRVEDLWWWSWAFALMTTAVAAVALLHAAFGLGPNEPSGLWWILGAVAAAFDLALLLGIQLTSRERPLP